MQTEAGVAAEVLFRQRMNFKDDGFPMRPRLPDLDTMTGNARTHRCTDT